MLSKEPFEKFNLSQSLKLEIPIIATHEVYYLNKDNGETFATVSTPTGKDVCVVFRTFNLQLNPEIMEKFGPGLNL